MTWQTQFTQEFLLWKYRTIALQPNPSQEMRFIIPHNLRNKFGPDFVPKGYYGNAIMLPTSVATAEELIKNSIAYALELIRKTKAEMTREYVQSAIDTLVVRDRPNFSAEGSFLISDVRHSGFRDVDFGWGKALYGGPPKAIPLLRSYCVAFENEKGENGFVVLVSLPAPAMERFAKELQTLLQTVEPINNDNKLSSAL